MTFSEAIKVQDGVVCNLPMHQARMDRTSQVFFDRKFELRPVVPDDMRTGLVKCRVVYGRQGIESVEFAPYTIRRSIGRVRIVRDDDIEYSHKSTDRSCFGKYLGSGYDEIVILKNGLVTDASYANLVIEDASGALYTPSTPLLHGTKRASLLENGVITEREVRLNDLQNATKVCLINAMIDLEDGVELRIM